MGSVEYEGDLTPFLPFLRAGEWAGVGRQTVWGKGFFPLDEGMAPGDLFSRLFGTNPGTGEPNLPWAYQNEVARGLRERRHILLTAPTAAGKTLAVLAPLLAFRHEIGAHRLIYCLPMKTLAQGIHAEAVKVAAMCGIEPELVTLQTGDHQGAPFFFQGDIIVCLGGHLKTGHTWTPQNRPTK